MKQTEYLFNALCNGVQQFSYSGLELRTKKADNEKLREMFPDFFKEHYCYEDRLMLLVKNGFNLYVVDVEGDEEEFIINKKILKERHKELKDNDDFIRLLLDFRSDNDDANTAFDYLQFIALGEIVYG